MRIGKKFAVYTAIPEGHDILQTIHGLWESEADFNVFHDKPIASSGWQWRSLYRRFADPHRNILRHKILSHEYFPQAEYSLWFDGWLQIKSTLSLDRWVAEYLGDCDLAVFKHPLRSCCYQEAGAAVHFRLDSSAMIDRQMQRYCEEGYPANHGLADGGVIFRRHSKSIKRFNEVWYAEIKAHSRCELLSLDYAAHKAGIKYAQIPGTIPENDHFALPPPVEILQPEKPVSIRIPPAFPSAETSFEKPHAIILAHPRSGTHFLQASLASHPKVHTRDVFIIKYKNSGFSEFLNFKAVKENIYTNKPSFVNIGIVMYYDVPIFEKLFGPLIETKIIHVLRNAANVARSSAHMWADSRHYGNNYRSDCAVDHEPIAHVPLTTQRIKEARALIIPDEKNEIQLNEMSSIEECLIEYRVAIEMTQRYYSKLLEMHPNKFEVNYDEITGNSQVNELPKTFCTQILNFLGLDYYPLTNNLRKTG